MTGCNNHIAGAKAEISSQRAVTGAPIPEGARFRVLLVGDQPLLRLGLRALLGRDPLIQVVAECGDASNAIECLTTHIPDAVIMDITLPGGTDGLELIKSMKALRPDVLILVLSVHDESLYAIRALMAGARGYLMKDSAATDLVRALHTMRTGEIAVSPSVAQRLVRRAVEGHLAYLDPATMLSDRELEVLCRIGRGQSTSEISSDLRVSVKTIESHRANLRKKLSLGSGAELLRYAVAWSYAEETSVSGSALNSQGK